VGLLQFYTYALLRFIQSCPFLVTDPGCLIEENKTRGVGWEGGGFYRRSRRWGRALEALGAVVRLWGAPGRSWRESSRVRGADEREGRSRDVVEPRVVQASVLAH
jgi:hypothetical protein